MCDIDASAWQDAVMNGRERTDRDEEEEGDMIHCRMVLLMAFIATLPGGQWLSKLKNSDNIIATSWLGIRPSGKKSEKLKKRRKDLSQSIHPTTFNEKKRRKAIKSVFISLFDYF